MYNDDLFVEGVLANWSKRRKFENMMCTCRNKIASALYAYMPKAATAITMVATKKKTWDVKLSMYITRDLNREKPIPDELFKKRFGIDPEQTLDLKDRIVRTLDMLERTTGTELETFTIILTYDGYYRAGYRLSAAAATVASNLTLDPMDFDSSQMIDLGMNKV